MPSKVSKQKRQMPRFFGMVFVLPGIIVRALARATSGLSLRVIRSNQFQKLNYQRLNLLYKFHLWARYPHDIWYSKNGRYKKYSDSPVSQNVHKATVLAFIVSFTVFSLMQYILPNVFNFGAPNKVYAGANSIYWDSKLDFTNNNGVTSATTKSNVDLDSTDGSIRITPTQTFGTGADGALVLDGTTAGASTLNGVQISDGGYTGPFNSSHPLVLDSYLPKTGNTYNFTSVTLQNNAVLTHSMGATRDGIEGIEIYATGTLTVSSGSSIDVSFKSNLYGASSGGGYAALGGCGTPQYSSTCSVVGGSTYGNRSAIQQMGSAGGGGWYDWGGGRVALMANTVNIAGSVNANGAGGGTNGRRCDIGSGGGSGGGILIKGAAVTVSGMVSAAGGGGGDCGQDGSPGSNGVGGAGGHNGGSGGGIGVGGAGGNARGGNGGLSAGGGSGHSSDTSYADGGGGSAGRIGIIASLVNGTSISSINGTYANTPGASNKIGPYAFYSYVPAYNSQANIGGTGASVGLRTNLDSTKAYSWTSVTSDYNTLNTGEAVKFLIRTSNDGSTWQIYDRNGSAVSDANIETAWSNSYLGKVYGGSLYSLPTSPIPASRYAEVLVRLESSTGNTTPVLNKVTLGYDSIDAPNNANITMLNSSSTFLKGSTGQDVTAGLGGGYTNENSIKVMATALTCGTGGSLCSYNSTNRYVTFQASTTNDFASPISVDGDSVRTSNGVDNTPGTADDIYSSTVTIRLVPGSSYYLRAATKDAEGRVSDWTNYAAGAVAFTVEQNAPTISTLSIATSTPGFIKSNTVTLNITAADTTGSPNSGLGYMQFSNDDGLSWGAVSNADGTLNNTQGACTGSNVWDGSTCWAPYATTFNNWNLIRGTNNGGIDGTRTVLVRVKDNAGNLSGKTFSQSDWSTATNDHLDITSGVKLQGYVGNGSDGSVTISSGSITIKTLYENDTSGCTGVTTARGSGKCLNKGAGTYNPATGSIPNFSNLTINSGATLTTTSLVSLEFKVSGSLSINAGGKIDAKGMGYSGGTEGQAGSSPAGTSGGGGPSTDWGIGGGGGGFSGLGGNGYGTTNHGSSYSYSFNLSNNDRGKIMGSGGGGGTVGTGGAGGNGGGAVIITANTINLAGSIDVSGNSGSSMNGGGGSGGSLFLAFSTRGTYSGAINADGGSGETSGGGGGGGYVKSSGAFATVQASGGIGGTDLGTPVFNGWCNTGGIEWESGTEQACWDDGGDPEYDYPDNHSGAAGATGSSITNLAFSAFLTSGTLGETGTALSFTASVPQKWSAINWGANALGAGQSIQFQISTDGSSWKGVDAGGSLQNGSWDNNYFGQIQGTGARSQIPVAFPVSSTIYVKLKLSSSGIDTPVLNSFSAQGSVPSQTVTLDTVNPIVPTNTIISPNGGEKLRGGSTQAVTWNAGGISDTNLGATPVQLYQDCMVGQSSVDVGIGTNMANSGSYGSYTVSSYDNDTCKIWLVVRDQAGNMAWDYSDSAFSIDSTVPTASVSALNANYNTSVIQVPYTASDNLTGIAKVNLYYTTNGGTSWTKFGGDFTSSPISFAAAGSANYGFRVVATDGAGNVMAAPSGGIAPDHSTLIDLDAPTASVSINEGNRTAANPVHLTITANDTGGSNLSTYELSNDGTNWSTPVSISGASYSNNNVSWTLASGDGLKTVYLRAKDGAGNYSGWQQSTQNDFSGGTRGSNIGVGSNKIFLLKPNGTAASDPSECISNYIDSGNCAANPWRNGVGGLSGKSVYYQDLGQYTWGATGSTCQGPQCIVGANWVSSYFVNPQSNPIVSFSAYPAENACAVKGGRLPNRTEFDAIYANQGTYGNNFRQDAWPYWTDAEAPAPSGSPSDSRDNYAMYYRFDYPASPYSSGGKSNPYYVRCVKDAATDSNGNGGLGSAGIYLSSTKDFGLNQSYLTVDWNGSVPSQAGANALRIQVGAKDVDSNWVDSDFLGPDGSTGTYYSSTGSGLWSGLSGHRYVKYKVYLSTLDNAYIPVVNSITVNSAGISQTSYDSTPPSDVVNLKSYQDINAAGGSYLDPSAWFTYASPDFRWDAANDVGSGLSHYNYCFSTTTCTPSTNIGNVTHLALDLSNLSTYPDGIYNFRIIAVDNVDLPSANVTSVTYKLDRNLPSQVSNMTSSPQNDRVTINWQATPTSGGSPIVSYLVERMDYYNFTVGHQGWTVSSNWSTGFKYASFETSNTSFTDYSTSAPAGDIPTGLYDTYSKLEPGVSYVYRVRAKDEAHDTWGAYPAQGFQAMTIDGKAPDDVTGVAAVACDGTVYDASNNPTGKCDAAENRGHEIMLTWNLSYDSSGIQKYNIYRADSGTSETWPKIGELVISSEAQELRYFDLTLNDYTTYFYRVTAVDNSNLHNESDKFPVINVNSNSGSDRTPDVTAPTKVSVSANGLGLDDSGNHQMVEISWNAANDRKSISDPIAICTFGVQVNANCGSGVAGYNLYRRKLAPVADPDYTLVRKLNNPATTNYNDQGLDDKAMYSYRVSAYDNESPANNAALSEIGDPLSDPSTASTYSSEVPDTPRGVTLTSKKGDPTDPEVGHKLTASFTGSSSRTYQVTQYELFLSKTNLTSPCNGGEKPAACWIRLNSPRQDIVTITPTASDSSTHIFDYTSFSTDEAIDDASTYYFKVRARDNTPSPPGDPSQGNLASGLSGIYPDPTNGWDTTPDATAPDVSGSNALDVKVKDTYPVPNLKYRNIITWKIPAEPTRNGVNDFARYEVYREVIGDDGQPISGKTAKVTTITTFTQNLYQDEIDVVTEGDLLTAKLRYYVVVVDNADSDFKYSNGQLINKDGSTVYSPNVSTKSYTSDTITPNLVDPELVGQVTLDPAKIGVSTAEVSWSTNQTTDAVVEFREKYKADGSLNNGYYTVIGENSNPTQDVRTQDHTVKIFGLKPSTEYDYQIVSKNYLGNPLTIGGSNVPVLKTKGFDISGINIITTTTGAVVSYNTNIWADGNYVEYQMQNSLNAAGGTAGQDMSPVLDAATHQLRNNLSPTEIADNLTSHKVVIGGLKSSQAYSYKIRSVSTDGYVTYSNLGSFSTKSFDTTQFSLAPSSSNVADRNITSTTAQIVWQTSVATTSWIEFGTASGTYGTSAGDNALSTTHVVNLTGLVPGTMYYYRARVKDANDVEYTSTEYSFRAILKPKISNFKIEEVKPYKISVSWETNVDTETLINWGKTTSYGEKRGKSEVSKNHLLTIDGLEDNMEYHFQIVAHDEVGNEVVDEDKNIRTPLDTAGPTIESVKTDILPMGSSDTTASVIISWNTDKPATTMVEYDEGIISSKYGMRSIEDQSLNLSHTVIIKELKPASSYHFRIVSKDKRQNVGLSLGYTFVTPSQEKSILQLILKSLEETFSWTKNMNQFFGGVAKRIRGGK